MNLRVKTKANVEKSVEFDEKEELELASPTSKYFLSSVLSIYVLSSFELEIPINLTLLSTFLKNDFSNAHPRLSSIPIEDDEGRIMWKKVEVNVEDHIKVPIFPEGLSPENYSEHLDDYISKIATSQISLHKPLWEYHIFNFPTKNATSTIIVKLHHAVGDGASLMGLLLASFRRVDDPTLPITFPSSTSKTTSKKKQTVMNRFKIVPNFISSICYSIYDFGQTLRVYFFEDDRTPIRSGNTNMALPYSTRVCPVTLSLNDVKRIKSQLGVTVNDVVIGIISFATRLYIQETNHGQFKQTRRMTASIAINMRSMKGYANPKEMHKGNTWGNQVSTIKLPLPNLDEDDMRNPLTFIGKIHKIMSKKKTNMGSLYLVGCFLHAIKLFGGVKAAARTFENGGKNSSFVITNLVGPTQQISIANHPIKGFYFVPTGFNLSLTVSVMSYMEMLTIGLVVEKDFIDHQRLIICVKKAFQLILEAATTTTSTTKLDAK